MCLLDAPLWVQGLFTAAVTLAAGGSLFVYALNRALSFVEFLHKRLLAGWVLAILVVGLIVGWAVSTGRLGGDWLRAYLLLPGCILLVVLVGEVRLVAQRKRYRAAPPISREELRFDGIKLVPADERTKRPLERLRRPITTMDLAVARYAVEVSGLALPEGSQGETLIVAQLGDFHYSPRLPFAYFRSAVERVIQEKADLVLLTGDFVTFEEDASRLPELLAGLRARLGVFATLGNHDYWTGSRAVVENLKLAGVHLIVNDCVRLPLWQELHLRLCGIDDPWGESPWQPPEFQPGDLNLIISHSADNIYRLRRYPFAAVFSGHFHAGQARLPGFGALVLPSRYGRRFEHGHFQFKNEAGAGFTHLFVSAGVGSAMPLLRLYCQPDVFIISFRLWR